MSRRTTKRKEQRLKKSINNYVMNSEKEHARLHRIDKDGLSLIYKPVTQTEMYYFQKIQVLIAQVKSLQLELGKTKSELHEAQDSTKEAKVEARKQVILDKELDKWKKEKKKLMEERNTAKDLAANLEKKLEKRERGYKELKQKLAVQDALIRESKTATRAIDNYIKNTPKPPLGSDEENE